LARSANFIIITFVVTLNIFDEAVLPAPLACCARGQLPRCPLVTPLAAAAAAAAEAAIGVGGGCVPVTPDCAHHITRSPSVGAMTEVTTRPRPLTVHCIRRPNRSYLLLYCIRDLRSIFYTRFNPV